MSHARSQHPNAPLTPEGRRRMVACVLEHGWTIEATAERFQVDAKTVRKWRDRFLAEGDAGSAGPVSRGRIGHRTGPRRACAGGCCSCAASAVGARITSRHEVGLAASTVQRSCDAAGCGRLDRGDRATDPTPVRRYQRERPGELIHVDVKKIAGDPRPVAAGGSTAAATTPTSGHTGVGYRYIHTALDDRTRHRLLRDPRRRTSRHRRRVLAPSRRLVRDHRHHAANASSPTTAPATGPGSGTAPAPRPAPP